MIQPYESIHFSLDNFAFLDRGFGIVVSLNDSLALFFLFN